MAPIRRRGRGRGVRRWNDGHNGGRVDRAEDTIAGDSVRRVLDSYCPYCATDIRAVASRHLIRCPNISICGKILPIDDDCCPSCAHYTRPSDNFCRICRANLRGVVRGRGGLYQQLRRAPSPINNVSPPREEENPDRGHLEDSDLEVEDDGEVVFMPSGDEEEDIHEDEEGGGQPFDEPEEHQQQVVAHAAPHNNIHGDVVAAGIGDGE